MRAFIPLLLALSASYTTVTALPKPMLVVREPSKPKYSVVPLAPDNGDDGSSGSGDSGSGSGSSASSTDDDSTVTVVKTVVKTKQPVTQTVTQTEDGTTVTAPAKTVTKESRTTISIINLGAGAQSTNGYTTAPQRTATDQASNNGGQSETSPEPTTAPQSKESKTTSQVSSTTSSSKTTIKESATKGSEASTKSGQQQYTSTFQISFTTTTTSAFNSSYVAQPTTTLGEGSDGSAPSHPISYSEPLVSTEPTRTQHTSTYSTPKPTTYVTIPTTFVTSSISISSSVPVSSSLPNTYDDGKWHTIYPPHTNGTIPRK